MLTTYNNFAKKEFWEVGCHKKRVKLSDLIKIIKNEFLILSFREPIKFDDFNKCLFLVLYRTKLAARVSFVDKPTISLRVRCTIRYGARV